MHIRSGVPAGTRPSKQSSEPVGPASTRSTLQDLFGPLIQALAGQLRRQSGLAVNFGLTRNITRPE